MRKQAREKEDTGKNRGSPYRAVTPPRVGRVKLRCQGKRNQKRNDEPAIVQPEFDSKDCRQLNLRFHGGPPCRRGTHRRLKSSVAEPLGRMITFVEWFSSRVLSDLHRFR